MKNCSIVEDLLELYQEQLLNQASKKFVEDHLAACPNCRQKLEDMRKAPDFTEDVNRQPMNFISQELKKEKRWQRVSVLSSLALILVLVISFLTWPTHRPYGEDLYQVLKSDKSSYLVFKQGIRVKQEQSPHPELQGKVINWLTAYTTPFDGIIKTDKLVAIEIPEDELAYYDNQDQKPAINMLSPGQDTKILQLPRLALKAYFAIALAALGIILVILLIKRPKGPTALAYLALPVAYLLGSLLTRGLGMGSYNMTRDFLFISVASLVIYLILFSLIQARQKSRW